MTIERLFNSPNQKQKCRWINSLIYLNLRFAYLIWICFTLTNLHTEWDRAIIIIISLTKKIGWPAKSSTTLSVSLRHPMHITLKIRITLWKSFHFFLIQNIPCAHHMNIIKCVWQLFKTGYAAFRTHVCSRIIIVHE